MGHVLFRMRQRRPAARGALAGTRLLVISAVAGLAFLAYTGAATGSICQTNCSATPVATESAQISTPTMPTTLWQGEPWPANAVGTPQDCGSYQEDPGNGTCDHYELTPQSSGAVRVTVTWTDPFNVFWLLVCLDTPAPTTSTATDDCSGPGAEAPLGPPFLVTGSLVAEDVNPNGEFRNFATATFVPTPGTTYEIRVVPHVDFPSDATGNQPDIYQGCAGYVSFGGCVPPSGGGVITPTTTSICPASIPSTTDPTMLESAQATAERRIWGAGDLANPDGTTTNTKQHFSFHVEQENDPDNMQSTNPPTWKGDVNYKNDGIVRFKSTSITCASFFDEGTDSNGDPKGSAEIRGEGTLRFDGGSKIDHECFRAFGRDAGDHPQGTDQFNIEFTNPDGNGKCSFSEPPAGRPLAKGNIHYRLDA
jgi:hypothetical protein